MLIEQYKKSSYNFIKVIDNNFEVLLCDLGASIVAIKYDGDYMTQTYVNDESFFKDDEYAGKLVGRTANRVKGNKVVIENKEYFIMNNEGENTLHGGKEGLSTKIFSYDIKEKEDEAEVIFSYLSKEGESGFPGNLNVKVSYLIKKGQKELIIKFNATTDKTTCCSLANHAYYTVGESSLEKTKLYINASNYLKCNPKDLLPMEKEVCPDILSFKQTKEIMKDVNNEIFLNSKANGYDHHFYFDEVNPDIVQLELIGTKYKMGIYTDYSGVQIYSCNHLNEDPCYGLFPIRRKSIAIEPQESFLDIHLLKPGETYSHYVKLVFSKL